MGWASGSYLGQDLWDEIRNFVPKNNHKKVAKIIYNMCNDMDADDWDVNSNLIKDADIKFEDYL